jgi:hypothetical protein
VHPRVIAERSADATDKIAALAGQLANAGVAVEAAKDLVDTVQAPARGRPEEKQMLCLEATAHLMKVVVQMAVFPTAIVTDEVATAVTEPVATSRPSRKK